MSLKPNNSPEQEEQYIQYKNQQKFLMRGGLPSDIITDNKTRYIVQKLLGEGTYGKVYLCTDFKQGLCCVKIQAQMSDDEWNLLHMFKAKAFENVVNTLDVGTCYGGKYKFVVMEVCEDNLFEMTQKNPVDDEKFRYIARQIANGVRELHSLGFMHRDIKPENILMFKKTDSQTRHTQIQYKICDLGLIKQQDISKTMYQGTPYYLAPEQLVEAQRPGYEQTYTQSVDIWALGCVFYEIVAKRTLFGGAHMAEIFQNIKNEDITKKVDVLNLRSSYKELIKKMVERNVQKRISIDEVIKTLSAQPSALFQSKSPAPLMQVAAPTRVPQAGYYQVRPADQKPKQQIISSNFAANSGQKQQQEIPPQNPPQGNQLNSGTAAIQRFMVSQQANPLSQHAIPPQYNEVQNNKNQQPVLVKRLGTCVPMSKNPNIQQQQPDQQTVIPSQPNKVQNPGIKASIQGLVDPRSGRQLIANDPKPRKIFLSPQPQPQPKLIQQPLKM